jgi:hypothetical protein
LNRTPAAAPVAPTPTPAPPPKQYQHRPPVPQKHTKVSPIPAPPTSGTSGGLNLVELQRRIAEAKSRLNGTPVPNVSPTFTIVSVLLLIYLLYRAVHLHLEYLCVLPKQNHLGYPLINQANSILKP